jgi:hypothetical protein
MEAQSDQRYAARLATNATSGANDRLYISNVGNNSITVYLHSASGNSRPMFIIAGPKTKLNNPGTLSLDALGNLYVANRGSASVLVFAHGANGNVAPIRTLAGPLTGIHLIEALTVDQLTGKLFVFDMVPGETGESALLRFPPDADGNEAPFARSATGLDPAIELASDSTGQYIIESHFEPCCSGSSVGLMTVEKQFPNGAGLAPIRNITILGNNGVADDPTTQTYLTSTGYGIYRMAETTNGHGAYLSSYPASFSPPIVSIINDTGAGQLATAPGPDPYTYAVHASAVYVYTENASGNAPPLRILSGTATGLNQPYGIAEGL